MDSETGGIVYLTPMPGQDELVRENDERLIGLGDSAACVKGPLSQDQISSIFSFHPSVHFVSVVNEDGTLLDSVKRAGLNPLEPPEETRKSMERWAAAKSYLAGSDTFLGHMRTIIVRREKLVELLFPSTNFMIVIGVHPAFPLDKIHQLEGLLNKLQVGGDEWRQA